MNLNPFLKTLPVYQPGRPIEEVARELGLPADSIIKVASNENPFGPSPLAIAAMQKGGSRREPVSRRQCVFYLKQKLAAKLGVETSNLVLGNGSNEIIEFIGHALLGQDTDIVVSQYCVVFYPIVAKMFGADVITVPAKNYGHDLHAMRKAMPTKTRAVFVANPNNPTGTLASRKEIIQFVNDVPDDDAAGDGRGLHRISGGRGGFCAAHPSRRAKKSHRVRTFSKIYGLAELRIGYGIGTPELVSALEKIRQPFNANLLAQTARARRAG